MRGSLRFFCVGLATTFIPLATALAMDCPAGYTELSSAGTDFGCIQDAPNPLPKSWNDADQDCFEMGARLPTTQEWRRSIDNLVLTSESTSVWLSDPSTDPDGGPTTARYFVTQPDPDIHDGAVGLLEVQYRCFIPAQGHSLAFLPTGPWWLTVALLATGVVLQRSHLSHRNGG